jgi:hypothetical protein
VQGSMAHHRRTHLFGAASPCAQFLQLEVREVEMAEEAFVEGLCVRARTRQKGSR